MSEVNKISFDGTIYDIGGSGGGGLTDEAKAALLACFENVAWVNGDGQTYYDALADALAANYTITNDLDNVTNSNSAESIRSGSTYTATLTAVSGDLIQVVVTMAGVDITSSVFTPSS